MFFFVISKEISFWMVCQMTMHGEVEFFNIFLVTVENGRVHRWGVGAKIEFLGDSDLGLFWQFLGPCSTVTSKNWIATIYFHVSLNNVTFEVHLTVVYCRYCRFYCVKNCNAITYISFDHTRLLNSIKLPKYDQWMWYFKTVSCLTNLSSRLNLF